MRKYLYLFLFITVISCNQVEPLEVKRPERLINADQMASVLTDMHLSEAIASVNDSIGKLQLNRYGAVYRKHNVSEEDFRNSFDYYKLRPVEIDSIYADVIQRLGLMEAEENGPAKSKLLNQNATGNQ